MNWRRTTNATRARAAAFTECATIAAGVADSLDKRKRFVEGHAAKQIADALVQLARREAKGTKEQ